jgi:DNA-binding SARP family transcriptional activator/tRNA A-37 threonylcarbamoyl transferase component Bud32/WD40 repeat protein
MDRSTTGSVPVEFRVLGPIEARVDGLPVDIGGFRQRRLLAVLISRAGGVIETDALAEYVWDDDDRPDNAVEAARTYISRLRRSFSEAGLDAASLIVTQAPGYRLILDDTEVDAARFEQLVMAARAQLDGGDAVAALVGLDDAIARWRGLPYQEFADQRWIESEVARLTELHAVAVEQRAAARLDLGAHAEVVGDLEKLVADEPLRARPVELLMLALYRSGRQAEALRAATRYRRAVGDVGLDPSGSFTELEARIAASDDDLQPVTASIDTIRGYRLADKIGEGSFSVVYRSVQPSLGREVAVKQIRAELADRPDFIRRFETEAQTVAALEHPHIVPLYDFWREPGSAYLVMRWLRGGTLATRLRRQRLDADESVTLVTQIGSALAAAHHTGIEHRDVRSSNVFVDELGNNYLGDFGIASDAQHNGGRDDTRGLGTLLFEAVTGKHPDGNGDRPALSTLRPDLPSAVEPVLLRAMVGSGDEAYATVEEFVEDYVTAIDGTARRSAGSTVIPLAEDVVNPYKGLRAFQESDAEDFRGRDRLIDRLLHQLAEPGPAGRLVAAVGPSGSGKSSLVRAGLIPRIRTGAIAGSDTWFVTTMIPGPRPFDELEAALNRIAVAPTAGLAETMSATPRGITRAVNSTVPDETSELLLVIDQFEELFTLADEASRAAFLDGLVTAVTDPRARLRVVATIRADHWHRPLQHPELAQLLETSAITVTPMVADELERAIVDPARSMGVSFEAGLVADIVAEVHDQPGALPLMQYLLTELFDEREAGLMELDTYRRLGGVAGGLARRADDLYNESSDTERDGIRRLFSRLVTPGEGTEDARRRVAASELSTIPETVIERYGAARLLTFDHDPATREPTVEVAHEAIIREWPRLRGWVDANRENLRIHRHLTTAAVEWDAAGQPATDLYRGIRLEAAEMFAAAYPEDLIPPETEYLAASVRQRDVDADVERRRVRRLRVLLTATAVIAALALGAGAIAWAQQRRADESAREAEAGRAAAEELGRSEAAARTEAERARGDAESATAAAERARGDAESATAAAEKARDDAESATAAAETGRLVAQSASFADSNPRLATLLALAAYQRDDAPAQLGALQTALVGAAPVLLHIGWGTTYQDVELLPGDRILGVRQDGVDLFDGSTGELVDSVAVEIGRIFGRGPENQRSSVASASGRPVFVVADRSNNDVVLFEATDTIDEVRRWRLETTPVSLAIDADGERVTASDEARRTYGWSSSGDQLFEPWQSDIPPGWWADVLVPLLGEDMVYREFYELIPIFVQPAPVGDALLVAEGPFVSLYDWSGNRLAGPSLPLAEIGPGQPIGIGSRDALLDPDGSIHVFGTDTVYSVPANGDWPERIDASFVPGLATDGSPDIVGVSAEGDGDALVVTTDGLVHVLEDDVLVPTLPSVELQAHAAAFDDERVVIASTVGIVVLSRQGGGPLARPFLRPDDAPSASVSRDGEFVVAGPTEPGGSTAVWHAETGRRLELRETVVVAPSYVGVAPDSSNRLVVYGFDANGSVVREVYDFVDEGLELHVRTLDDTVLGATSDVKGDIVARTTLGGTTELADVESGAVLRTLDQPAGPVDASFHPTRDWLLVGSRMGPAVLYDTNSWTPVPGVDLSGETISTGQWSLDGELLATVALGDGIDIRNGSTFEVIRHIDLPAASADVWNDPALIFSADTSLLLTNVDGPGRLWDVATGEPIGRPAANELIGGNSGVNWGEFPQLVTVNDRAVLQWNLDPGSWPQLACRVAGSNLTRSEWDQWGPRDEPFRALCPRWSDVGRS